MVGSSAAAIPEMLVVTTVYFSVTREAQEFGRRSSQRLGTHIHTPARVT